MTPRDWNALREIDREYVARLDAHLTEEQALAIYEALWQEAVDCGAVEASYAREDLDAKIEMVRTLNSLRPVDHV